ncbi:MAG: N-acetylmuramoyl-L-alanine amidase [Chloroflexi bacterium]|nr:MAG: N-acetylmuramoyl-L-alanine amidase [Chloroflexota bacterium]
MDYSIIQYPALPSAYSAQKPGRRVDMIVMHSTGGVKTGDLWTLSGRDRRHLVSIHYYITKLGEIYQLVQDKDVAWHAGVSFWQGENDVNRFSIGIELENLNNGRDTYPQAQIDAALWLVRNKVQEFKIPRSRLVRHAQVALPPGRKSDPRGFPWDSFAGQVYTNIEAGPPPPPATPPPANTVLRTALIDSAYRRARHTYHPDWALHQFALSQRIGPPLLPMFQFKAENRGWVGEVYGVDAICSPVGAWNDIRRLSQLPEGELKTVFRNEVYRGLGATYHADWAFHQYADRNPIGLPLSESFRITLGGGEAYTAQIFTLDTLISPYGQWNVIFPLSNLLDAPNLEPRDAELRDTIINRQYQRIGAKYHPEWAMHQAATKLGLGVPLSGQEQIEMGVQDYVAQSYARDVVYSPVGEWGTVKQLADLL